MWKVIPGNSYRVLLPIYECHTLEYIQNRWLMGSSFTFRDVLGSRKELHTHLATSYKQTLYYRYNFAKM